MKYSVTAFKMIAIVSFLILSAVQYVLLYNTYQLTNDHYRVPEREAIKAEYFNVIRNDKVMPGGQQILDSFLYKNMNELQRLYGEDKPAFAIFRQKVMDSAFAALIHANNMDSLLRVITERNHLNSNLAYALFIKSLDISFKKNTYVSCFNHKERYDYIDPAIQTSYGARIGGTLKDIYPQSLVTDLTVSSNTDRSYRITFDLYLDQYNRKSKIMQLMLPSFALSLFSIGSVILLFFVTFRNWLRQKQLSEMKSDFINGITHEFNTPLSAIIVANRAMQNEKITARRENLLPLTDVIQRQADRLKNLIGQVLHLATLHKIGLSKAEYSIHALLDSLVADYRFKLEEANVEVRLEKKAPKDIVQVDEFWFSSIFINLLDNAVKYNNSQNKLIVIATYGDRKNIYVKVADNGVGMSPEIKKHAFDKFYRNIRNVNSQVKGLGLGLYYVKQAAEAHGWEVRLESEEGAGSTFIIQIPL